VVQYLVVGGAERLLEHLVRGFAARRRVGIICTGDTGSWFERFAAIPNCVVESVAHLVGDSARQTQEIVALVDRWRASVVHISNSEAGYRATPALCARYPRPWLVATLHSDQRRR